jgi:transporter family-2 protein
MNSLSHPIFYASLMIIAGIGIPVMAALNAGLGSKIQSPLFATVVLLVVGLITAAVLLIFSEGIPSFNFDNSIPTYYYFAGLLFLFYILTITWVAPKFGIGNAVAFVLLGQLLSMTIIDHFSLFNAINYPISTQRLIGLILMTAGVFLVVRKG